MELYYFILSFMKVLLNVFEEILKVRLGDCDIWNYKTQVLINLGRTQDAENSAKQSQMQGCQVYAPTK